MADYTTIDDNVHQIVTGNSTGQTPKKIYGGGNGGGVMEPTVPLKEYVDAQDNAIESRLASKLDSLPTRGTVWGAAGTVLGLLLAALALAGDRFDGGVGASSLLQEQAEKQAATDAAQDAQLKLMDDKLDILITQTADQ